MRAAAGEGGRKPATFAEATGSRKPGADRGPEPPEPEGEGARRVFAARD